MNHVKRHVIIATGVCVAVLGLVLMPVPGPGGTPVFLAGLAILSTEFKWARDFLARFKEVYGKMSKRKRLTLTYSMLAFYLVSGVIAWNWTNRSGQNIMENTHG